MDATGFANYLAVAARGRRSGSKFRPLVVKDAVSRCRRVESVLAVDLDDLLRRRKLHTVLVWIKTQRGQFAFHCDPARGIRALVWAVGLYAKFVDHSRAVRRRRRVARAARSQPACGERQ